MRTDNVKRVIFVAKDVFSSLKDFQTGLARNNFCFLEHEKLH